MQVSLIAAISANGQIAQAPGQRSLDWTSKEDLKFFVEKTKELGVVIMGRKTFETIGKPLKGRRVVVMTSQIPPLDKGGLGGVEGTVEYTHLAPRELLEFLALEGVGKVAIAGGASVYSQFLAQGLVTDLYLTIEPVLFGQGVPLASGFDRIDLWLVDIQKIGEGTVVMHYKK